MYGGVLKSGVFGATPEDLAKVFVSLQMRKAGPPGMGEEADALQPTVYGSGRSNVGGGVTVYNVEWLMPHSDFDDEVSSDGFRFQSMVVVDPKADTAHEMHWKAPARIWGGVWRESGEYVFDNMIILP
jgi:hypothetical protein